MPKTKAQPTERGKCKHCGLTITWVQSPWWLWAINPAKPYETSTCPSLRDPESPTRYRGHQS
jgi:hypothetical protein